MSARQSLCPEAEDLWPEHRRGAKVLVEREAAVSQLKAFVGLAQGPDRDALNDQAAGMPDGVFALGGDLHDTLGPLARGVHPTAPHVEDRTVEDRIRERVRVTESLGQGDRCR